MTQTFDAALRRLESLLRHERWPERLIWVDLSQVIVVPMKVTFIYLTRRSGDFERARLTFDSARDRGLPIEIYGAGFRDGTTFATVRTIDELGQGEAMFLEEN